ncbi:hypothetical protein BJ508DRAFT_36253 [Ascobolus immersus RN42]|uniref:Uncharacterized protein n=1 Tax=Ascobolus immersus RN42 TaxID=1160509 RepID=A0A3N4IJF9_ASCIM|nr:hypothetical protein BJ508DRAFT_36253 [Ascobolus immersus RN42]
MLLNPSTPSTNIVNLPSRDDIHVRVQAARKARVNLPKQWNFPDILEASNHTNVKFPRRSVRSSEEVAVEDVSYVVKLVGGADDGWIAVDFCAEEGVCVAELEEGEGGAFGVDFEADLEGDEEEGMGWTGWVGWGGIPSRAGGLMAIRQEGRRYGTYIPVLCRVVHLFPISPVGYVWWTVFTGDCPTQGSYITTLYDVSAFDGNEIAASGCIVTDASLQLVA